MLFPHPPSPRNLQSKPGQARGKNSVSKSELKHQFAHGSRRVFQAVENMNLSSSSDSIEAPKGCLSYFISHCSPSPSPSAAAAASITRKIDLNRHSQAKTSKSARVSRLPRSKPFRFIKENSPSKSVSKKLHRVKKSKTSIPEKHPEESEAVDATKIAPCSKLDHLVACNGNSNDEKSNTSSSNTKTPPLQASFSPEIQSTAITAKTPACYAAGHLISRVTDKRKCKARGVLSVAQSGLNDETSNTSSGNTKTPPLQASFSPEIQSTATMAATPACYAAGHLLSGVTDKRKCRARGVLAVAQSGLADNDILTDNSHNVGLEKHCEAGLDNKFSVTMLPSPTEASMHWLLSPCRENDQDDNESSASLHNLLEKHKTRLSPLSPLSDLGFSLDWCNFSNDTSDTTNSGTEKCRRNSMFISTEGPPFGPSLDCLSDCAPLDSSSPNVMPYSGAILLKEEEKHCYYIKGGNSPLSADTLGSGNVMQTPKSDSSLERPVRISRSSLKDHKRHHHLHSELLSMVGDLRMASLSPENHVSIWDTTSSSFKFDRLSTPSNSMDLSQLQKVLDDRYLWTSNSTFENVSQSEMRISWREGLASRIFEMDEFDSCRCLSDEEEDLNVDKQSFDIDVDAGNVPTLRDGNETKEKLHSPLQCSYAESISTDGDGLAQSTDSDWNLCYKNSLFQS